MDGFTEQTDVLDLRPALVATGIWVSVGLALDAYLLVRGKDRPCGVMTDVLRTKPGKIGLAVLCLHVANRLGRVDPFRAAASLINGRTSSIPVLTDARPGK